MVGFNSVQRTTCSFILIPAEGAALAEPVVVTTPGYRYEEPAMLSMITSLTGPESWTWSKGLAPKLMIEQIRRKFIVTAE